MLSGGVQLWHVRLSTVCHALCFSFDAHAQVFALEDADINDPTRLVDLLKEPPMQLLFDTAPGQGPRWVRQAFVHCDSKFVLDLPHSNPGHVKRYVDGCT